MRTTVLTDEAFDAFIDSTSVYISEAAGRNFQKWPELYVTDPAYFVDELRNFIHDRLEWLDAALVSDFVAAPDANFNITLQTGLTYQFTPETSGADYTWDFGDGTNSNEENPTHTYAVEGDYLVALTVNQFYGCVGNSSSMYQIISSVDNTIQQTIQLYPNPAADVAFIAINNSSEIDAVEVFTMQGTKMNPTISNASNRISINLAGFAAGTYLVKINVNGIIETFPLIVE